MVKLAVVGGALQGMEVTYLAKKAGFETVVMDRDPGAPALSMGDHREIIDPLMDPMTFMDVISDCDAVIPANENMMLLNSLVGLTKAAEVPLLFDIDAYRITTSKIQSNALFSTLGLTMPNQWPHCGFPAVVKPSACSGSKGFRVVKNADEMHDALQYVSDIGHEPVIQKFLSGRNLSLEIIRDGRTSHPYLTTEIMLDDRYDCKGVFCSPNIVTDEAHQRLEDYSVRIAEQLDLCGLMDVEAIMDGDEPYLLEVDARFPSQTPAAVFHASGINLLSELYSIKIKGNPGNRPRRGYSLYEHFTSVNGLLRSCGEKRFATVHHPEIVPGFYGADEAITDYRQGSKKWSAAVMISGNSEQEVLRRRQDCISQMMDDNDLMIFIDPKPAEAI